MNGDRPDTGDATTGLELSLQELIYAGLDALRAARPAIDLVAYLHAAGDAGPQLFLGAPVLGSLQPNEAFDLFTALRDALKAPRGDLGSDRSDRSADSDHAAGEVLLGGFHALTVVTAGQLSRGLHVVGRRDEGMADADQAVLAPLAAKLGTVHHRLEEVSRHVVT